MPEAKHGIFYWNELMTWDVEAAVQFYKDVIGWSFDEVAMPEGGIYYVGKVDDQPVGGIMAMMPGTPKETPPYWMGYIAVDDIDARLEKAKAAGATVLNEPFDVEGIGRIAMLKDGGGGTIGWMTPV